MKNFIITTVMALLIGGFSLTANAQDKKTKTIERKRAKTEKQVKIKRNKPDLELDVNRDSMKVQNDAEQQAIQENTDVFNEFVKAVDDCELEYNKEHKKNTQFNQCLEKALRLSKKINTKKLTDAQKTTYETSKVKLNGLLKR